MVGFKKGSRQFSGRCVCSCSCDPESIGVAFSGRSCGSLSEMAMMSLKARAPPNCLCRLSFLRIPQMLPLPSFQRQQERSMHTAWECLGLKPHDLLGSGALAYSLCSCFTSAFFPGPSRVGSNSLPFWLSIRFLVTASVRSAGGRQLYHQTCLPSSGSTRCEHVAD